jgi:monovalent cation/proton antiporter MnhG/PhaG subunit
MTDNPAVQIIAAILIVGSAIVIFSAAVGVVRFPDAFTRMHAATKAGVVGAGGLLLGASLALGNWSDVFMAAVGVFFLVATVTIAAHTLGRAAYLSGAPLAENTKTDALQDVYERHDFDGTHQKPQPSGNPAPGRPGQARPE